MKDMLETNNFLKPVQIGKIVEGKVVGRGRSAIFLDLGVSGTGIIYGKEFQEAKEDLKDLKIGETLFAKITDLENEEGYIELSLNQASHELNWEKLRQLKEKGEIITVKILGANKGGLLSEVSNIPAFLPVSQLLPEHYPRVEGAEGNKILKELQKLVGKELEIKIFNVDPRENKLILSERAKESEKIKEVLKKYKVGQIVEGEITGITDFGVFMKFPIFSSAKTSEEKKSVKEKEEQLEGLIHISELDWQIIEDPSDIVKVGEKIKAKIISISDDKVSLSLKALKKDPWQEIESKYNKGDVVKGQVTKFNPYGAFIQIIPKTEISSVKIQGLCHISEFGTKARMEELLKIGGGYDFQILSISPKEHRMSLKLAEKE